MTETDTRARAVPPRPRRHVDTSRQFSWWGMVAASFRSGVGLAGVVVIAAQTLWRGASVAGGFFSQDDYLLLQRAADEPMGLAHLGASHAGEFSPVGNLLVWLTTQVAGFSWGGVTVVVLLLQLAVAVLTWVVLTQVLEDRWVKVPLLAVACFTPLTFGPTLWWSVASTHLPAVLLLLLGFSALLAHLREGWRPGLGLATFCLAAVLLCSDRALTLPLAAFVLVAAMLPPDDAGIRTRLVGAARRYAMLWVLLLVAVAARLLVGAGRETSSYGLPTSFDDASYVVEQFLREGVSGLVGGPWVGTVSTLALSPDSRWPLAVAILLCVVLAVPVVRSLRQPVVVVAVGGLVLQVVLALGAVLLTRDGIGAIGIVSRAVADMVPVVVVLLAVALRRTPVPTELRRFVVGSSAIAASVLAVVAVVSTTVTTRATAPTLKNEDDRAYVDHIRSGLEVDPRIVLLDGPVPEGVMSALFGSPARVSTVVGLLPQQPTFDMPSEVLRMVDGLGILREVDLGFAVTSATAPEGDCGWAVTGRRTTIPLESDVAAGDHVLEIGYLTSGDTYADVRVGEEQVRIPVRAGLHQIQLPVTSAFSRVTVTLEDPELTVCVGSVAVGVPTPAPFPGAG